VASSEAGSPAEQAAAEVVEAAPVADQQTETPVDPATVEAAATPDASMVVATTSSSMATGKEVYKAACFACHETGVAGAPQSGKKEDWAFRLNYPKRIMYRSALEGRGGMPAMGGHPEYSDDEIRLAVDYLIDQVR
jgi:cytochrome c5